MSTASRGRDDAAESARFVEEIKQIADQLLADRADRGDLKLIARALGELREGFDLFARYRHRPKVTMFGSARTAPDDPLYQHAMEAGAALARAGYMVITGAGPGIMEAGHRGAGAENSIGINIVLPFEQSANPVIAHDEKLVNLRYFFTRKLLFVKETDAIVLFPGGFGTQDEGFETLTMVQTGKAEIMPIIMVDRPGGTYWSHFDRYVRTELLQGGMISAEDLSLYRVTTSIDDVLDEITTFYRVYDSQRYVRGQLVLRLRHRLDAAMVDRLNDEFADIVTSGRIRIGGPHPDEFNEPRLKDLARLYVPFNRRSYGRLRQLIDLVNQTVAPSE